MNPASWQPTASTPSTTSEPSRDEEFVQFRPFHFNDRQRARLLVLRGQIADGRLGIGRFVEDGLTLPRHGGH
jgi:hypothetical protein